MSRVRVASAVAAVAGLLALLAFRPWGTGEPGAAQPPAAAADLATETRTPEAEAAPAAPSVTRLAHRRYETLLRGQRAGAYDILWTEERLPEYGEEPVVRDVTRHRRRTARRMGHVRDVFEDTTTSVTVRTPDGDLLSMETEVVTELRTDRVAVRRVEGGYAVERSVGGNEERFEVESDGHVKVDAEAFLGPFVRDGTARPGGVFECKLLDVARRRVVDARLTVEGHDDEGPGLRVVEEVEGSRTLWWFAEDGAVERLRVGDVVVRRADDVTLDDLPAAPAVTTITLPCDRTLPRIFSTVAMEVDVHVDTDETVALPELPESPFSREVSRGDGHVRLRLLAHDDPGATSPMPPDATGLERHLEPTPLMEVEDPAVAAAAREAVGDAEDAREAARRIADWVFRFLDKESPPIPEPTAREILDLGTGDCSEHALLFTALCRAAGIPARRCSGYVCIGEDWGTHGWSEVWLGSWVGADPTTNEVGTRARYILLARPDEPETKPAVLFPERIRIEIRRAEFAEGVLDFASGEVDGALHSGVALDDLPEGWRVRHDGESAYLGSPAFRAKISIEPDHGYRDLDRLARTRYRGMSEATFGGRPALHARRGRQEMWVVPLPREHLVVHVLRLEDEDPAAALAAALRPTLERE